jgi:hypothetical protein
MLDVIDAVHRFVQRAAGHGVRLILKPGVAAARAEENAAEAWKDDLVLLVIVTWLELVVRSPPVRTFSSSKPTHRE